MQKKAISPGAEILTELNVDGKRIGFKNKFLKLAMLVPRDELKDREQEQYDRAIECLKKQGYDIRNLCPKGKTAQNARPGYDILQSL